MNALRCFVAMVMASAMPAMAELPGGAVVLDHDVLIYHLPEPLISPDGRWVVYASRGFLCVNEVADPRPRRIAELKGTWSHVLAEQEMRKAREALLYGGAALDRVELKAVRDKVTHRVLSLQWTYDSSAIVWGLQHLDLESKESLATFWLSSPEGKKRLLLSVEYGISERGLGDKCKLTRDRRYFVQPHHKRPLIWNVEKNSPRATPFCHLTPSKTSGSWIGIEKDTRQLVVVNADFEVVERFDAYLPNRSFGFALDWSPDERYVLWRNQVGFDHFSNWEGFCLDLRTMRKQELDGRYMGEGFEFSGNGGEFIRYGATGRKTRGYDRAVGAHIVMYQEGGTSHRDIWRISEETGGVARSARNYGVNVRPSSNYQLFAAALPRQGENRVGFEWHLMDRDGMSWRFPGVDGGKYYSPWKVVGFADRDTKVVCFDEHKLFAIPVSTIQTAQVE